MNHLVRPQFGVECQEARLCGLRGPYAHGPGSLPSAGAAAAAADSALTHHEVCTEDHYDLSSLKRHPK